MTETMTLYIGNRNLSSWSLRPWLLMRQLKVPFHEVVLELDRRETRDEIRRHSPSGKVPVLEVDGATVWDSLAITELIHELFPDRGVWPTDRKRRAWARSIVAEMHSSFADLRKELSMNITGRFPKHHLSTSAQHDVDRVMAIWREARLASVGEGPFLFGSFSAADAFYAPVVTRFQTYVVPVTEEARVYMDTILSLEPMRAWIDAARVEVETKAR
jgi:glutathione S-transferase